MEYLDQRREPRYPIEADVTLQKEVGGEAISTVSTNLSGAGMYLHVPDSAAVNVGDTVTCEVSLPQGTEDALAKWGTGVVVRVDDSGAAIQLNSGLFEAPDGPK